jgi:carotenoid cleavage dioxygenase-like enzyme
LRAAIIERIEREAEKGEQGRLTMKMNSLVDPAIIDALYLDRLRAGESVPAPQLRRYVIDLDGDGVSWEPLADTDLELPRIDYRRRNGRPYRYVYGAALNGSWLARIVKVDLERGESSGWAADGCWPGEPLFVPAPDSEAEDAGVLLSVVLDAAREASFLLVLDAATLEEVARAAVPHAIPFSFHGQFFGA